MKTNYDLLIEALEKEREELLKANPDLKKYQDELDNALAGVTDPLERAAILNQLLVDKLAKELIPAMAELKQVDSEVRAEENKRRKAKVS
jgi:capsule polysaccharide export protein KpsE/RkpR